MTVGRSLGNSLTQLVAHFKSRGRLDGGPSSNPTQIVGKADPTQSPPLHIRHRWTSNLSEYPVSTVAACRLRELCQLCPRNRCTAPHTFVCRIWENPLLVFALF